MALGLVLIFKSSYIFNFAQGQLLLIGALMTWWLSIEAGLPLWISILLALAISALLGLGIAIPAIAAYSILRNRIARLVLEVGILSEGLMSRFERVGPPQKK